MQTGENMQGLRKVTDLTRMASLLVLGLHFYVFLYPAFVQWQLTHPIVYRLWRGLQGTGLLDHAYWTKGAALGLLLVALVGTHGKKAEDLTIGQILAWLVTGLLLYGGSVLLLRWSADIQLVALCYMVVTGTGYLLVLRGGSLCSRLLKVRLQQDIFNKRQETFPQEERLIENPNSVNLPARYRLQKQVRRSWINIVDPFRGLLVTGTPGSGKSYFVIRHVITQHIRKGFSMFVYDFKFDDLSVIAYNTFLKYRRNYAVRPRFYVINFDDLSLSNRCNPLHPESMQDITDATESSRTIMLGLNRDWIRKSGHFFVESPINFVTAIIWFLKKYYHGKYCTLPHVIELMQVDYEKLFPVLRTEPEIEVLINPFVTAYTNGAMEQLEGQVASAKITMARLSSPQLYYVLSGNDFTLDLNNPEAPKIICMGNNPQKQQVYGAVLSLYISRMIRLVNRKGQLKSSLVFDEFPTIYFNAIDGLMATARSNKVATTLGVQDLSQLRKDYGREMADVVMNISGNVISGQVVGTTAQQLSDRFGRIMQQRQSLSVSGSDTSFSRSSHLDRAIPASAIASLSSGEFVGMVADDPSERIDLKVFHAEVCNDHKALRAESSRYLPIPSTHKVTTKAVVANYRKIKQEVADLVAKEMHRICTSPELAGLLVDQRKNGR